ncbi:hypothetical protein [Methanofollis fontis]|uniref:Uncharacterized protein n=1 Tax=Methanofollis fontis TaxID=2052832 RepID=A0A483CRU1_9EURY|nr:hypothetical protein [Methanofollis fontis]TAJ44931.1 hypothetical protein CUJ86_06530 [Methanofollis fontis]
MRVRDRERLALEGGIAATGLALSIALLLVVPDAVSGPLHPFLSYPIGFFIGFLVPGVCGLMIEGQARKHGTNLLALITPIAAVYLIRSADPAIPAVAAGILAALTATALTLVQNRFDTLAESIRLMFMLLFATCAISTILLILSSPPLLVAGGCALLFIMALFVRRMGPQIRPSEIFMIGPTGSGKTLLMVALYTYIVGEYAGTRRSVILSGEGQEETMRIEHLISGLESGHLPPPTRGTDLAIYRFSGKKYGVIPVETGIVDYAGSHAASIDDSAGFAAAVETIAGGIGTEPAEIIAHIGGFDYMKQLKERHASDIAGIMDAVVTACIFRRAETATRILFLIDGDDIVHFHTTGRQRLTSLFGYYTQVMDLLGSERAYGFVVTKADRIRNIRDIEERSDEALRIEQEIYEILLPISTFHEIHNRALTIPIHFYAVSVNAMLEPEDQEREEGETGFRQVYPWGIGEVARFGI